jgi:hypothetical protein
VTTVVTDPRTTGAGSPGWWARRLERRAERHRLARQDGLAARLGELHHIRALLEDAVVLLDVGWVQHAWFAVIDDQGGRRRLAAHEVHLVEERPVSGACLVGGIVHAGGGPQAVRSQLVQRTLELTWHTLYEGERQSVRWCPSPAVRGAHVRDLTRWNDHPQRTRQDVAGLLHSAVALTDTQIERCRAESAALQECRS